VRRALRRTLRIADSVISDNEVYSLCSMLDADNSGTVCISELVAFLGPTETLSKVDNIPRLDPVTPRNSMLQPSEELTGGGA